ncbi:DUF6241 domain-containing protein [Bhargavaea cecembensis]|uniref:DUF6241 domain-containing protein n=1 Tax=Bhargavaea cecembensis TaxID=394098 RepID=UPI000694E97F|nr:DUF6241 domain-containing protein [Bhargavaea cecembensis]
MKRKRWLLAAAIVALAAGAVLFIFRDSAVPPGPPSDLPVPEGKEDGQLYDEPPDEERMMQDLHRMTHQKIDAKQKWGALQITRRRIDEMLRTVEEGNYAHGDLYRDILTKWQEGDFSNTVEAHNAIWDLQDGTVGKAKRLLTREEEEDFIRRQFGRKANDGQEKDKE